MEPSQHPYESALVKCRGLLAVMAENSGATPGERAAARAALRRLMERHGITADALARKVEKRERVLKFSGNMNSVRLIGQLCRWIVGDGSLALRVLRATRGKYAIAAELSEYEFEEWRASSAHYLSALKKTEAALAEAEKLAKAARKNALTAFLHRFDIFPPDARRGGGSSTPELIAAIMAAMSAVKGDAWQRDARCIAGAQRLTGG